MKKSFAKRLGSLLMVFAMVIAMGFTGTITVKADSVSPDDGRFEPIDGGQYMIHPATKTDAGWTAYVYVFGEKMDASVEEATQKALADTHVINGSALIYEFTNPDGSGSVSTTTLSTLKAKGMSLDVDSWDNSANESVGMFSFQSITNTSKAFPLSSVKANVSNEAISKKLKDAGYTGLYVINQVTGTGALPGVFSGFMADMPMGTLTVSEWTPEDPGMKNVYFYNTAADSLECVGSARFYQYNDMGHLSVFNCTITKSGYFVVADSKLPDSVANSNISNVVIPAVATQEDTTTVIDSYIETSQAGETINISLPAGKKIEKDSLKKAMDKGVKITIPTTTAKWSFDKIVNPIDFDPTVTVGKNVNADVTKAISGVKISDTMKYTEVSFAFDGTLPGTAKVELDLSDAGFTDGQKVLLYYLNPETNKFEKTGEAVYKAGVAAFDFNHCSDYIVTSEALPAEIVANTTPPVTAGTNVKTGDTSPIAICVVALVLAGAALAVIYKKKRNA